MKVMVAHLSIDEICTDNWEVFLAVFGGGNHHIGKHLTKEIEDVNSSLRARNRRFVRKTTCFSKKSENHDAQITIMLHQWNHSFLNYSLLTFSHSKDTEFFGACYWGCASCR
ncbi:MAG: IS1 family transposase [Bacteroidia bacterium]|nr:IS1 family transposase [Bacteroidia bacterium]